jgi:putative membrane protein
MEYETQNDPRIYMAAERTFLAWLRTGVAFMGFGFVVARFGLFMREVVAGGVPVQPRSGSFSLPVGIVLIVIGVVVNLVAALRHRQYIAAIDRGQFRSAFGSTFAFVVAALLALIGLAMAVYLAGI